jgi:hypothetical protein
MRARLATSFSGYDAFWYGIAPALAYLGLGASAVASFGALAWTIAGVAASLMILLLISIHNEWDLVTFLAPSAQPTSSAPSEQPPNE